MSLTWDDPRSDPVGDFRRAVAEAERAGLGVRHVSFGTRVIDSITDYQRRLMEHSQEPTRHQLGQLKSATTRIRNQQKKERAPARALPSACRTTAAARAAARTRPSRGRGRHAADRHRTARDHRPVGDRLGRALGRRPLGRGRAVRYNTRNALVQGGESRGVS